MASLVQTLDQFCIANEEARTRAFADFLPALLAADAGCGYCWRIHHHLMLALPHFVHMFTSDEVCSSITTCWPCCTLSTCLQVTQLPFHHHMLAWLHFVYVLAVLRFALQTGCHDLACSSSVHQW